MSDQPNSPTDFLGRAIDGVIAFCLHNKLVVFLALVVVIGVGLATMPFGWDTGWLPRDPVPVDAIPDIGENQQIVFTEWMGRSPQDVEDQITYPLTIKLLAVPGVKSVRSYSYFGFSSIYVIFEEDVEFYWSRSRILEQLNVAQKELPEGVIPTLGPDATALGQIFWYTLEGRDVETGEPTGGWDLDELRSIQDWQVRYALQSAKGVSEVASVGGFVREYQVDVDPDAMRAFGVTLSDIYDAVRKSNVDVGARTIEINRVEYVIRGLGLLEGVSDIENTVVTTRDNVPVLVRHVATVSQGPAVRRGALDKAGAEAVGGVVVVRFGANPMEVIENVKKQIDLIQDGLPEKTLDDGRVSRVTIVPFYDRTQLIDETLGTLETALTEEIMVTIIVVIIMVMNLRSSLLISSLLPLAVLITFVAMKVSGVDSNIMSLSGIAIAIGTMVDMGVILSENMLKHLDEADEDEPRSTLIFRAASEVGRPVLTAILTTVVSFLPVFTMVGPEGKLFRPLAFTKTFALLASVGVALTLLPAIAHVLFGLRIRKQLLKIIAGACVILVSLCMLLLKLFAGWPLLGAGAIVLLGGIYLCVSDLLPRIVRLIVTRAANFIIVAYVLFILTGYWMPLGLGAGFFRNLFFIVIAVAGLLLFFLAFMQIYEPLLRFFLRFKYVFFVFPLISIVLAVVVWQGFHRVFGFVPWTAAKVGIAEENVRENRMWEWADGTFPGLGSEFMPPLEEGSFLYMPTTMPHASIGEAMDVLRKQDMAINAIPEVETVVGKIGRADSALDPAPVSMVETIITYKSEYSKPDPKTGERKRLWRDHIRTADDIWREIERVAKVPGSTTAPKLQPIAARIVMLQTGVRAPMAVRILGQELEDIEKVAVTIERLLKSGKVEGIEPATVFADRIVGKPYLVIKPERDEAMARYGITIQDIQEVIETAIGGETVTKTVEGRERYAVRVRYQRELRDNIESINRILVAASDGSQIPLQQLATIEFVRGPQVIKSEKGRHVGYVIFDKKEGYAEVEVVERAKEFLDRKIEEAKNRRRREGPDWRPGEMDLLLPAGVERPQFIGNYENQQRSAKTLAVVVPLALLIIFVILYLQFRSIFTTWLVWFGVLIACSGGMILLWLYSTTWFADVDILGTNMRDLFQVQTFNLSVAVWVGFIALLGIATDDGVVVASYLDQSFAKSKPDGIQAIREATVNAGLRRIRPCLMTTATTILALLPVLTSRGRGSDVMVPMAIPTFGGMLIALMTLFAVPVGYCLVKEIKYRLGLRVS